MITRDEAIAIAREAAKAKPQSYYTEPFTPHEWVIDAIINASALPAALREVEVAEELIKSARHLARTQSPLAIAYIDRYLKLMNINFTKDAEPVVEVGFSGWQVTP